VTGHPAHKGDKILAAFMHQNVSYSRHGSQRLPKAYRAMKGWRRLSPGSSRKAFPLPVWSAIACEMKRRDHTQMALYTMMGVSAYTRPSELLRCRVFSLIKPSPRVTEHWCLLLNPEELPERSKTGEFDDSIPLDSGYLKPWAQPLFKALTTKGGGEPLWSFDYGRYSKVFQEVTEALGLDVTPYQMRHSGPSIDRSKDLRPLIEVQKRGRWKSHKSLARYEKSARLAANFQQLPLPVQQHCLLAESLLEDVMCGRARAPLPPSKQRA